MDVLEAVYARRSVKLFDKDHALTDAEEKQLLQATIQAPTSFNVQHWRLVVFRDAELRQKIRDEFAGGQSQVTDASLLVLFTGKTRSRRSRNNWSKRLDLSTSSGVSFFSGMRRIGLSAWRCKT